MIYFVVISALLMLIGFVGMFIGRAYQPAWLGVDTLQYFLILPMLNHNTPEHIMTVLRFI